MSKKNKKSTRRNAHAFDLKRAKEEQELMAKKKQKKELKLKAKGLKVGKKKVRAGTKLSKSEKSAVAKNSMDIDG